MIYEVIILGILVLIALHIVAVSRFSGRARRLAARVARGAVVTPVPDLPEIVQAFALRAGAGQDQGLRALRLTQRAQLKMSEDKPFRPIAARQTIALGTPGFVWDADLRRRGLRVFRIIDALVRGRGILQAQFLGSIPVARGKGAELDRSEAMRYLAELPWAPDAILGNPDLQWQVDEDGWVRVSIAQDPQPAQVRMRFEDGDIVEIHAPDRPSRDRRGRVTSREWRGLFSEYGQIGGRRIPLVGEVGYVTDGVYAPYWRGRIISYKLLR